MIEYVRRHRGIHAFRRNGMYLRRMNHLCEHIDQGVEEGLHYRLRCVKSEYTNTGAKSKDVWNEYDDGRDEIAQKKRAVPDRSIPPPSSSSAPPFRSNHTTCQVRG